MTVLVGAGEVYEIWLNIMDPFITLGKVPLDETFAVLRLPARVQTLYF